MIRYRADTRDPSPTRLAQSRAASRESCRSILSVDLACLDTWYTCLMNSKCFGVLFFIHGKILERLEREVRFKVEGGHSPTRHETSLINQRQTATSPFAAIAEDPDMSRHAHEDEVM